MLSLSRASWRNVAAGQVALAASFHLRLYWSSTYAGRVLRIASLSSAALPISYAPRGVDGGNLKRAAAGRYAWRRSAPSRSPSPSVAARRRGRFGEPLFILPPPPGQWSRSGTERQLAAARPAAGAPSPRPNWGQSGRPITQRFLAPHKARGHGQACSRSHLRCLVAQKLPVAAQPKHVPNFVGAEINAGDIGKHQGSLAVKPCNSYVAFKNFGNFWCPYNIRLPVLHKRLLKQNKFLPRSPRNTTSKCGDLRLF